MIKKWLLVLNALGEVTMIEKEMSYAVPINRVLDQVGFYVVDSVNVNGTTYLINYEDSERYVKKTKILVTKIGLIDGKEGMVSLEEEDKVNIKEMINMLMAIKRLPQS